MWLRLLFYFLFSDGILGWRGIYRRSWGLFNQMRGKNVTFLALLFFGCPVFWGACCVHQKAQAQEELLSNNI